MAAICSILLAAKENTNDNESVTAEDVFLKAVEYCNRGQLIETGRALRQAWVMGEKDKVEEFLQEHSEIMDGIDLFQGKRRSNDDYIKGFAKLDSLGFREGGFMTGYLHAIMAGDSVGLKFLSDNVSDPFSLFMMADFLELDIFGRELDRDKKQELYLQAADSGCILAYNELAVFYLKRQLIDGQWVNVDLEKGQEYFWKAYNNGCLRASGIGNFLRTLEEHPEIKVTPEVRHNLYRMEAIDFDYWYELMKSLRYVEKKNKKVPA